MNNEHSPTSCVSVSVTAADLSLVDRSSNGASVLIVVWFLNCWPTFTCNGNQPTTGCH